ncbi:Peptidase A22B signal peptide peptidase [Penicillium sp. DV-2018c]|nr:Peptidase A22B signal peptide peptidase [Penicillium sp. DV-2018c]KAJ5571380.1 Peptidase A22B signal peptide peptidase [Penicillium sp. DV-2018c]
MADVSPVAELLGQALYHYERLRPLLPTYGHLIISALFPIWISAHASLTRPSSAAEPPKKKANEHNDDYDTEDEEGHGPFQKVEGLEPSDALMFPLTAGLTLGGLYLLIKWLEDPAILNKILGFYFSQMGLFFAYAFLKDVLLMIRSCIFPRYYRQGGRLWKVKQSERLFITSEKGNSANSPAIRHSPLPGLFGRIPLPGTVLRLFWRCRNVSYQRLQVRAHIRGLFDVKSLVGLPNVTSGILALVAVAYFAFVENPWWLTNFFGFCFCYGTLQFISPSTFWTGTLILGSLFFYDIYFVFFTPLMVTVATKLDIPIKLLFPRPPTSHDAPGSVSLAMLGLGDIVIPGMMVGLALRFDLFLYYQRKGAQLIRTEAQDQATVKPVYQSATGAWGERFWAPTTKPLRPELHPPYHDARAFPKTYFKASIFGYVAGMVTTLLAMQYSNHAQPALLYLVPGVLISLWGTALIRGETSAMWEFSDAEQEECDKEKEDEIKDKASTVSKKSLFMRAFCGGSIQTSESEDTADVSKSGTKSSEREVGDIETMKDEKARDTSELVSFSISIPRSRKSEAEDSPPEPPLIESEIEEIPASRDPSGTDEPPLKRRRRSVMNKASTS